MYKQKIKIFTHNEVEKLENSVNEWLTDNTTDGRCVIMKILQSESTKGWTLTIYYNEAEK
ncbi:hypothetical protein CLV62_10497 [Dysgonomonas alginatilytica]|uniref:DUF4177 domain-containing protein n=1 Tax=Dysgonomonas alginatilytica TaxID=1605892 RepID=A0A2V3PRL4_9BACT|nr:hypothetical protein [Dysgonomonas alginatilytica]PXV66836.1 hypothetical protein CLV62_10497 [Dysgonomonas alginatilytica]